MSLFSPPPDAEKTHRKVFESVVFFGTGKSNAFSLIHQRLVPQNFGKLCRKYNELILDDLLSTLEEGRSPLLLTERTEHLDELAQRLKGAAKNVIVLKDGARQIRTVVVNFYGMSLGLFHFFSR